MFIPLPFVHASCSTGQNHVHRQHCLRSNQTLHAWQQLWHSCFQCVHLPNFDRQHHVFVNEFEGMFPKVVRCNSRRLHKVNKENILSLPNWSETEFRILTKSRTSLNGSHAHAQLCTIDCQQAWPLTKDARILWKFPIGWTVWRGPKRAWSPLLACHLCVIHGSQTWTESCLRMTVQVQIDLWTVHKFHKFLVMCMVLPHASLTPRKCCSMNISFSMTTRPAERATQCLFAAKKSHVFHGRHRSAFAALVKTFQLGTWVCWVHCHSVLTDSSC